jgi:predicted NBD/HSP70 family sugar kinase
LEPDKRYIIGIDLGTTNSAVSYVDLTQDLRKTENPDFQGSPADRAWGNDPASGAPFIFIYSGHL